MKNPRIEGKALGSAAPASGNPIQTEPDFSTRQQPGRQLLERWRRLSTGLRGVRLFKVTLPDKGRIFWEAECTLNGTEVGRRFASELHARAWLSVATQPNRAVSSVERQELDRPCSTSCFSSGG